MLSTGYADVVELGSDGSAASGGKSDLSEWQRSIKSRISVSPKILSGTATGRLVGFRVYYLNTDPPCALLPVQ